VVCWQSFSFKRAPPRSIVPVVRDVSQVFSFPTRKVPLFLAVSSLLPSPPLPTSPFRRAERFPRAVPWLEFVLFAVDRRRRRRRTRTRGISALKLRALNLPARSGTWIPSALRSA